VSFVGERLGPAVERAPERRAEAIAADVLADLKREGGPAGRVTAEALAHVYETTLVEAPLRKALGIHGTPPFLTGYILDRLEPHIRELPAEARHVFEPACGPARFLVAAMRTLRDLLPAGQDANAYLQEHLHGLEAEPTARAIARLSLTLDGGPDPDRWQLHPGDMFEGDSLARLAERTTILLANPPFERFGAGERARHARAGAPVRLATKAEEMLHRLLPHLPAGALVGVVLPRGALQSKGGAKLRSRLLRELTILELLLLPDNVFAFAEPETAVLLARKAPPAAGHRVVYKRVQKHQLDELRATGGARFEREIAQAELDPSDLTLPELHDVWSASAARTLDELAELGRGFEHKGRGDLRDGVKTCSDEPFPGAVPGYLSMDESVALHGLPRERWVNSDPSVLRRRGVGLVRGVPQVLVNHHRTSRGPWRLKAMIDDEGRVASGRFVVLRPRSAEAPVELLWALCNSPYANAYVATHNGERDINPSLLKRLPVPACRAADVERITGAVRAYLEAARALDRAAGRQPEAELRCRALQRRIDTLVLRAYDLPAGLERSMLLWLDQARGGDRRSGLPFVWERFAPEGACAQGPSIEAREITPSGGRRGRS
jgi:hypothetical protein